MTRVPEKMAGGPRDRTGDLEDHCGDRLVIFDAERDEPPLALLGHLTTNGGLYKSVTETRRLSALSRERWGTFGQLFAMHREDPWRFHVKMACSRDSSRDVREHLWFEVLELKPDQVRCRLISDPLDVPTLATGDELWQPLESLTDWLILTPDGPYDP